MESDWTLDKNGLLTEVKPCRFDAKISVGPKDSLKPGGDNLTAVRSHSLTDLSCMEQNEQSHLDLNVTGTNVSEGVVPKRRSTSGSAHHASSMHVGQVSRRQETQLTLASNHQVNARGV